MKLSRLVSVTYVAAIGSEEDGSEDFFRGLIDDVRIYHRALSSAEVKELYQTTLDRP